MKKCGGRHNILIRHDKVYTVFINKSKLRKSRETRVEMCVLMLPVSAFLCISS